MPTKHPKQKLALKVPPIRVLITTLRAAADELEELEPLLDAGTVASVLVEAHQALTVLRNTLPKAHRVPKKHYLQARAAWLEAWSRDAAHLRRAARAVLAESAPDKTVPASVGAAHEPLCWLVEIIAAEGVRKAIELTKWLAPEPAAPPDYGMKIDRAANHALQVWGRMKRADFLGKWDMLNADMITRSAIAVGLPALKRWPQAAREELHRRALRFVRNTLV